MPQTRSQDLEVLAGGVHEAHGVAVEHARERRHVDREGVDHHGVAAGQASCSSARWA